jgi:alkanesulfonate monooxygenase SsuD/methylene tetrahydromethanopterin reductase-like flavin-dependent oxidoreductase (luciferase family)
VKVWLFNLFPWSTFGTDEIPYPFPGSKYDRQAGQDLYDGCLTLDRRADELGFDGIVLGEHHYATNSTLPSPNLMAAALAATTKSARIVLLGNCLPLHNPIRLAEELAMIDVLSHGRLVSGFVRGGPREYFSYGANIKDGRALFEEESELIIKAWTEPEPFEWHSEHYDFGLVSVIPRPMQQPHPPLIMAANTAESIEWAARHHAALITAFSSIDAINEVFGYYRKYAREQCGWEPGPEMTGVSRQAFVGTDDEAAREEARPYLAQLYGRRAQLWDRPEIRQMAKERVTERSYAYSTHGPRTMPVGSTRDDPEAQTSAFDHHCVAGTPDVVTRRLIEDQAAMGSGLLLTSLPFGPMPPSVAMRSLELFGKEVLPHLHAVRDAVPA